VVVAEDVVDVVRAANERAERAATAEAAGAVVDVPARHAVEVCADAVLRAVIGAAGVDENGSAQGDDEDCGEEEEQADSRH
jgi:hypothetical protein